MRIVWSFSPKNEMVYRLVDIHFHGLACSGHAIHPSQRSSVLTSAPITLEENVWLGANVTVVGGVFNRETNLKFMEVFMNKEWSEMNKTMQLQIKKKDTFSTGIDTLLTLREELMKQILQFKTELSFDDFSAMPYMNAKGYHSKTIAYSLWHIFRIEDIVAHTLISDDEQVLFKGDYQRRINSPIITTANELVKEEISEFSKKLSIEELYNYIIDVDTSTTQVLKALAYSDIKEKITDEKRKQLEMLNVVSGDENAYWLIDYWCGKDVKGLIQMPFSRHWIMHIEACLKIRDKQLSIK